MNTSHRIGLVAAAVVVLVVAFVLIGTGGDDTATTPTTPPAAETAAEAPETSAEEAPEPEPEPEPRVERIRLPLDGEPRTLRFERGDTVRLRVSASDADVGEIHVHGYDRVLTVPAGRTRTLTFEAELEGIFEVEDHHTGELLAELEVRPS